MRPSLVLNSAGSQAIKQGAKRDPELYALAAVMTGIFGVAGYYFGSNPTSATSENKNAPVHKMPWEHQGSASDKDVKEVPSALNSVVVPNVNLPKELHDKYNKWGKEGY